MRGEGYEPVHTSTIERFYRCFYQLNRFIIHRVERVHYAGFTDRREKGLDGVKQNPVEMAGSEVFALNFIHFGLVIGLKQGFSDNFTEVYVPKPLR